MRWLAPGGANTNLPWSFAVSAVPTTPQQYARVSLCWSNTHGLWARCLLRSRSTLLLSRSSQRPRRAHRTMRRTPRSRMPWFSAYTIMGFASCEKSWICWKTFFNRTAGQRHRTVTCAALPPRCRLLQCGWQSLLIRFARSKSKPGSKTDGRSFAANATRKRRAVVAQEASGCTATRRKRNMLMVAPPPRRRRTGCMPLCAPFYVFAC